MTARLISTSGRRVRIHAGSGELGPDRVVAGRVRGPDVRRAAAADVRRRPERFLVGCTATRVDGNGDDGDDEDGRSDGHGGRQPDDGPRVGRRRNACRLAVAVALIGRLLGRH